MSGMQNQKRKHGWITWDARGSILLAVVMIYSFFALALFLTATLMLLDQMGAEYTVKAMQAFYIAEAGLAYGIAYAQNGYTAVASLLPGEDGIGGGVHKEDDGLFPFGGNVPYDKGRFTVRIRDNEEPDRDPYNDTDTVFILSSTAYIDPHVRKTLLVFLQCRPACSVSAWLEAE